jgi:hypothetical protein
MSMYFNKQINRIMLVDRVGPSVGKPESGRSVCKLVVDGWVVYAFGSIMVLLLTRKRATRTTKTRFT